MLLIGISCAWALGIFIGSIAGLSPFLIFSCLLPVPLIFISKNYRKPLLLLSLSLASFFAAAYYYPTAVPRNEQLVPFNNLGNVEINGVIETPPESRDNITHIELTSREIKLNGQWQKIEGTILLYVPRYPEYRYGDVLKIIGKLESPPQFDNFDYQAYLAKKGIYSTMLNPHIEVVRRGAASKPFAWVYTLRKNMSRSLSSALPEPQASLAQGIVLGIRSTIPDNLKTDLSITGAAHLLAISGINLSIIAGVLVTSGVWLFGRRHYVYVWLALFVIWFYSLITGMQAPVVRSAIMASIFLLAELLGRQKNIHVALAFSAAVMIGITPQILRSVSFQLSFLAMLGLVFVAPTIQYLGKRTIGAAIGEEGPGSRILLGVADSFSITLGAIIAVWPVIAYNFGIVSIVGPLSTFLIAPALTPIIFCGAATAIAGLISPAAAQVIGWSAWLFLSYMLWLVNAFASLPLAAIHTGTINNNLAWIYYGIIGAIIWIKVNFKKTIALFSRSLGALKEVSSKRIIDVLTILPKKWIVIPLIFLAFITSFTAATLPDDELHVSILDVGEGDAILVQTGNRNILIDGGPSPQAIALGLSRKISFWNRKLNLVVLTHPHLDHLSGLVEVLSRYRVERVLAPNLISTSNTFREWLSLIKNKNIRYDLARAGQQIALGKGANLEVLNPPDTNPDENEAALENKGIVARLSRDKVSFLFTADIGEETESRLVTQRANLGCTVLKVSHHGSETSTTSAFLSVARPQIAVISAGADNTYGHPSMKVLTRLKDASVSENNIYRTDLSGTIEFTTDGQKLWVKTERE
jgi:competence protein ComEC